MTGERLKKENLFFKLSPIILSLSCIKLIANKKIYLNVFPLLIAFWQMRTFKISKIYLPFLLLFIYEFVLFLVGEVPSISVLRSGQMMVLAFFGDYLIENFKKINWSHFSLLVIFISIVIGLWEFFYNPILTEKRFGLSFGRLYLIVGEPNFSALLLLTVFSYCLILKNLWASFIAVILLILGMSRMAILGIPIVCLVYSMRNFRAFRKVFIFSSVIFNFIYPILIPLVTYFLNDEQRMYLINKVTTRFYIQMGYLDMFVKQPWGVGYFNGASRIGDFYKANWDYLTGTLALPPGSLELTQAHNFFIHFMGELGIPGLLVFIFLMVLLCRESVKCPDKTVMMVPFLIGALMFNLNHEVAFFFIVAFVLHDSKLPKLNFKNASWN